MFLSVQKLWRLLNLHSRPRRHSWSVRKNWLGGPRDRTGHDQTICDSPEARYDLRVRPKKFMDGDWCTIYIQESESVGARNGRECTPGRTWCWCTEFIVVSDTTECEVQADPGTCRQVEEGGRRFAKELAGWADTSDESEEGDAWDLFEDEQPPSIKEEPTRPKQARKPPEKFKDFVRQVQSDTGIRGRRRSQKPSEKQHSGLADDKPEYVATP